MWLQHKYRLCALEWHASAVFLWPLCQIRAVEILNNGLPCVCTRKVLLLYWIYCCFIIITNINKNSLQIKIVQCSLQGAPCSTINIPHGKTFVLIVIKQLTINTNAFSFKCSIWNWRRLLIPQSNPFFHYHSRVLTFMSTHAPSHPSLLPLEPIFSYSTRAKISQTQFSLLKTVWRSLSCVEHFE